jgi:hypothetical protein
MEGDTQNSEKKQLCVNRYEQVVKEPEAKEREM